MSDASAMNAETESRPTVSADAIAAIAAITTATTSDIYTAIGTANSTAIGTAIANAHGTAIHIAAIAVEAADAAATIAVEAAAAHAIATAINGTAGIVNITNIANINADAVAITIAKAVAATAAAKAKDAAEDAVEHTMPTGSLSSSTTLKLTYATSREFRNALARMPAKSTLRVNPADTPSNCVKLIAGTYGTTKTPDLVAVDQNGAVHISPKAYADDMVAFVLCAIRSNPTIDDSIKQHLADFVNAMDSRADKRHGYSDSPEEKSLVWIPV